jgi:hypothetical protein
MPRFVAFAGLLVLFLLPAAAEVNPRIHKLCLEAKDYLGCVKAMKGESEDGIRTTRQIIQRGSDLSDGNQCPAQMAYRGGGNCQEVVCLDQGKWFVGKHNQLLAGKGWECLGGGIGSGGRLEWGAATARTSLTKKCPIYEPTPGFNSTCSESLITGRLVGSGLLVGATGNKFYIRHLMSGSSAEASKASVGDEVLSLNGIEWSLVLRTWPTIGSKELYALRGKDGDYQVELEVAEYMLDKSGLKLFRELSGYGPK